MKLPESNQKGIANQRRETRFLVLNAEQSQTEWLKKSVLKNNSLNWKAKEFSGKKHNSFQSEKRGCRNRLHCTYRRVVKIRQL